MRKRSRSVAKTTCPLLSGYRLSERIFSLMDASGDHPVLWISCPAGCGMTTLVTISLRELSLACLCCREPEDTLSPAAPETDRHSVCLGIGWNLMGSLWLHVFTIEQIVRERTVRNQILSGTGKNLCHFTGIGEGCRYLGEEYGVL